ncbi:MAG: ion transporter, partial [Chthoniobacterales bacterium]
MSKQDLEALPMKSGVSPWRLRLATWAESRRIQHFIVAVILLNAVILGLETSKTIMGQLGG